LEKSGIEVAFLDAHNTHAHSPLWIHVRKPHPMRTSEGLSTGRSELEILEITTGASSSTKTTLTT
jgi:hypothetical protein